MSTKWLLLISGLLVLEAGAAQAHDIYSRLTDKLGWSCCDNHDCQPAHYRITASGVQMFLGSAWVTIPAGAIMYRALEGDTGETGGGHWCGAYAPFERAFLTRCAVLPPSSASASDAPSSASPSIQ